MSEGSEVPMLPSTHADAHFRTLRGLAAVGVLLLLAACDTPVGVAPNLQGSYWQNAVVTNPSGGGPQVVRWGPPQNWNPSGRN